MRQEAYPAEEITALSAVLDSAEFASRINVASDLAQVLELVRQSDEMRCLLDLCQQDRSVTGQVLRELEERCQAPVDSRYESPWDTGILARLWILREKGTAEELGVGSRLAREARQGWWSRKLAESLAARVPALPVVDWVVVEDQVGVPARVLRQLEGVRLNWTCPQCGQGQDADLAQASALADVAGSPGVVVAELACSSCHGWGQIWIACEVTARVAPTPKA